jgi:uncharacterized protein YqeY
MSYTNNWTQIIRQLMVESHTKQELMKLSNDELKKLHGEYMDKGDEDSQKEAKVIKEILDERGDDKEEVSEGKIKDKIKGKIKEVVKKGKKIAGKVGQTIIDDQRAKGIFDQSRY